MPLVLIAILALVQGVTEFLPISSSAHLVLTREVFGGLGPGAMQPDPAAELVLDVALHVGTLFAVALYFRKDVAALIIGGISLLRGRRDGPAHMAWLVMVATVPAFLAGGLLKELITTDMRGLEVIAWTTLIFGIALGIADRMPTNRAVNDLTWKGALVIGAAQALALVPGVSRSGIAMTAARWLRLARDEAARFALLLALPTIAGAGALAGLDVWQSDGDAGLGGDALIGALMAFAAAYGAIHLMMRWLKNASFLAFVIYRIALGLVLLWLAYGVA
jgi:undecaprenyl-diphosphatase